MQFTFTKEIEIKDTMRFYYLFAVKFLKSHFSFLITYNLKITVV